MEFDHIGVFVKDIDIGKMLIAKLLPIIRYSEIFDDPFLQVRVQFLYDSKGICYELVAPFGPENPVDGVLKSRRNIINHVAYKTANLDETLERLRDEGSLPLGEPKKAIAFKGKRVVFLITPMNFIIELIEE